MKVANCSYSSSERAAAMPGMSPLTSVIRSSGASELAWSTRERSTGWFIQSVSGDVVMWWNGVGGWAGDGRVPPDRRRAWSTSSLSLAKLDPLDPAILGPRIVDPQRHDIARFLGLERLAQVGLRPHGLAFDGQNDVRPALLRVVEEHLPGRAAWGDVGDDEPAGVGGELQLLRRVGAHRLHADAESVHRGAARGRLPFLGRLVRGSHLRGVLQRLQLHAEGLVHAAFAGHLDLDLVARLAEPDHLLELAHVLHGLAVHRDDDVARLDAGGLGGGVVVGNVLHYHAPDLGQPDVLGVVDGHVRDGNAERGAVHPARLDELGHDGADQVHRDGEAVARVESGLAGDGRVDPDDLAADAHQWAPGVAGVDGRIGLDKVLDAALASALQPAESPPLGAHDTRRDGEGEPFAQRIADRQHPLADSGVVAIAQRHRRQLGGVDLEHRHVGIRIGADDLGLELAPIEQPYGDLLGALHDVVVGQNVAIGRDDEPGAAALLDLGLLAEAG